MSPYCDVDCLPAMIASTCLRYTSQKHNFNHSDVWSGPPLPTSSSPTSFHTHNHLVGDIYVMNR